LKLSYCGQQFASELGGRRSFPPCSPVLSEQYFEVDIKKESV